MTEDEAKTKWCPFARGPIYVRDPRGPGRYRSRRQAGAGRWAFGLAALVDIILAGSLAVAPLGGSRSIWDGRRSVGLQQFTESSPVHFVHRPIDKTSLDKQEMFLCDKVTICNQWGRPRKLERFCAWEYCTNSNPEIIFAIARVIGREALRDHIELSIPLLQWRIPGWIDTIIPVYYWLMTYVRNVSEGEYFIANSIWPSLENMRISFQPSTIRRNHCCMFFANLTDQDEQGEQSNDSGCQSDPRKLLGLAKLPFPEAPLGGAMLFGFGGWLSNRGLARGRGGQRALGALIAIPGGILALGWGIIPLVLGPGSPWALCR